MSKIKSSENKAEQVETKPPETVETMSSEKLALLLDQQNQTIMQCNQNRMIIMQELQKRQKG